MAALGGLAVLLAVATWCGWSAWTAANDLREVERAAERVRSELVAGDAEGAARALADYQAAADGAVDRTDGAAWWVAERLPLLGDDAAGVAVAAQVLADVGRDGLPPLVDAADTVTAREFQPDDSTFPLETIAAMRRPARQSEQAFDDAAAGLDDVDSTGFLAPIRQRYDALDDLVREARATLGSAYRAAEIMPELLGADRPRRYLLVMQNNAELRSTGGLAGSLSLIRARGGSVDIVEQEAAANFHRREAPVLPLTAEERRVFGDVLGTYLVDANLTPDVPRAADLVRARWEEVTGVGVDGVFFVDPVAVSYLLAATGPIDVPGHGSVTAGTVVAQVENEVYLTTEDRDAHDDFQHAVAEAVFDTFAEGKGDPAAIISGLVRAVDEGRVRLHSFVPQVQQQIAGTDIAGELPDEPTEQPTVGVYLNDSTESKMSYYLHYDVDMRARSCTDGVQELVGSVELFSDTPDDVRLLPPSVTGYHDDSTIVPGQQLVLLILASPVGGSIEEVEVQGRDLRPEVWTFEGRSVAVVGAILDPEERQTIDMVLRSGPDQTGDTDLFVTPGAAPGTESATLRTACVS